ncbi:PIN family toxin-antitoxin system, partial [Fusobacterium animalis]
MLAKFFNDEKLTFATNSANLPTSWLQ